MNFRPFKMIVPKKKRMLWRISKKQKKNKKEVDPFLVELQEIKKFESRGK